MKRSFQKKTIIDFTLEGKEKKSTNVIMEAGVDIYINSVYWLSLMCTPNNIRELSTGFLFNEGIINSNQEIKLLDLCENGSRADIWLNHSVELPKQWKRTSGCTGGATAVNQANLPKVNLQTTEINGSKLLILNEQLLSKQELYSISGGVHSSALSDGKEILVMMEDIGRHNTLDKIAGWCIINSININPSIILTTGRISSEMLQKSSRIGASILVSRTSPSSLAIDLAKELGVCLIGYARRDRFKIYTHPEYVSEQ